MPASTWLRRAVAGAITAALLGLAPTADAAVFSCDDPGIQTAAATGGGPHTFSCAGPTTVIVSGTLAIFASVILDGGGNLSVSGGNAAQVFSVGAGSVELRDLGVTAGSSLGGPGGCIVVASGASLTLADVTVSGCTTVLGTSHNIGGAIANDGTLTLTDSVVSGNTGSIGGGIASGNLSATASVNLTRSRVSGNTPTFAVGGVHIFAGNLTVTDSMISGNGHFGLGIITGVAGTRTVTRSTISGNTGGGILTSASALAISNSTVAQNGGPGIQNNGGVALTNSTLAGNTGGSLPSALYHPSGGTETLLDTIVAGTCTPGGRTSSGGNIESPGNGCGLIHASDHVNVSAAALNLGTLGNHGGPTQSVPLLAASVAIDSAVSCPPPAMDQRGVARPQGAGCDSGAFELGIAVPLLVEDGMAALAAALVVSGALALRYGRRITSVTVD